MAYEFNKKMLLQNTPSPAPDFELVKAKIKELIMTSNHYFPHEKDLDKSLKNSFISAEDLAKEVTLEKIKELEKNWGNSVEQFKGLKVQMKEINQLEGLTPENDLIKKLKETDETIKENTNNSKLKLAKDEDYKMEASLQKLNLNIENGMSPQLALAEFENSLVKENTMKGMPTIGQKGFNVHDRIAATLKNKEDRKACELVGDVLGKKNHDIASKCDSGYYSTSLINSASGNLMHLAAEHNPESLAILVYKGGGNINQISPDSVAAPETKKEIERLQYEVNHPIKSALGIKNPNK